MKKLNFSKDPKFAIEHNHDGLNFYIAWPEPNQSDYKLFISEKTCEKLALLETIKDLQDRAEQPEQRNDVKSLSTGSLPTASDVVANCSEYLSQNIPNPINGSAVIRYSLPEGTTQAFISVYGASGAPVKTFPIDVKKKNDSLTLRASDLAKGINVYNLTVNGAILSSKKMVNP